MKTSNAVTALAALAQETRLELFRLLVQAGEAGLSVGKIAESLNTKPNGRLTFHLKSLVSAGLVNALPDGRFIYYSANYPAMNELLAFLTRNCCGGASCGETFVPCDPKNQKTAT